MGGPSPFLLRAAAAGRCLARAKPTVSPSRSPSLSELPFGRSLVADAQALLPRLAWSGGCTKKYARVKGAGGFYRGTLFRGTTRGAHRGSRRLPTAPLGVQNAVTVFTFLAHNLMERRAQEEKPWVFLSHHNARRRAPAAKWKQNFRKRPQGCAESCEPRSQQFKKHKLSYKVIKCSYASPTAGRAFMTQARSGRRRGSRIYHSETRILQCVLYQ